MVGVQYLEAWLGGMGCVPLYNLMEDAATAEICRTQVCNSSLSKDCVDLMISYMLVLSALRRLQATED